MTTYYITTDYEQTAECYDGKSIEWVENRTRELMAREPLTCAWCIMDAEGEVVTDFGIVKGLMGY